MYKSLKDIYNFKIQLDVISKNSPKKGDMLLGHPHSFPLQPSETLYQIKIGKRLLFINNEDPFQLSYINRFINECDRYSTLWLLV